VAAIRDVLELLFATFEDAAADLPPWETEAQAAPLAARGSTPSSKR